MLGRLIGGCWVGLVASLAVTTPPLAADHFAGKAIRLVVGSGAGGGFDIYGRAIARHLGRHIPGNPAVIVQNMPGAGGGKAASYLYSVAPKDGTAIAAILPGTIFNPLLSGATQQYDPSKFRYIGTADNGTRLCITSRSSPIKTFDDAQTRRMTVGATAPGSSMFDYAQLLRNIAKAQFQIVGGYKSTAEIGLALDRGEVDGLCGWDWSSLQAQQPNFNEKYNIILQTGMEPNPELKKMGVPIIQSYVSGSEDRQVLDLFLAQQIFGRPYVAPPGIAEEHLAILKRAFDLTLKDTQFLDDSRKLKLQTTAASGALVEDVVMKMYQTPRHIIERAADLVKP